MFGFPMVGAENFQKEAHFMTATTTPTKVKVSGKPSNYAARKAFAQQTSGYSPSSPIWGKQLAEVLQLIEKEVQTGTPQRTLAIIGELRKRIAYGKLMAAQK